MPRSHSPSVLWFVAAPLALVIALALWGPALTSLARLYTAQYRGDVYAFYLDSGHTFYGTVRGVGFGTITLANVYSFQTVSVGQTPTSNLTAQELNPLTAPENWMTISREHVLFYEKLGDKAKVLKIMRGDAQ